MLEPAAIGNFRILRQLGSGGMGTVYEAMNDAIERRVAIKVLRPEYATNQEFVWRFFNEARAVNRIEHPSLVQISEYGQTPEGTVYIVMEYLRGETLTARLHRFHTRGTRQPLTQTLQTAWQLAEALAAAHDKGIVHRDLKPDNVILVPDPVAPCGERAKLLDFGIAKLVQSNLDHTGTMVIMGTPSYMSPEQCRGAGEVNDRTDVYSLGTMLYQMVAGRLPFVGEGSGDLIGQHLHIAPPPLGTLAPSTPPRLVELVHRLLIKDKATRPSMREVLAELRRLLDGSAARSLPAAELGARSVGRSGSSTASVMVTVSTDNSLLREPGSRPKSKQRRLFGAVALGSLLVAGVLGGKLAWQPRGTGQRAAPGPTRRLDSGVPATRQTTPTRPVSAIPTLKEPAAAPAIAPPPRLLATQIEQLAIAPGRTAQSADQARKGSEAAVGRLPVHAPLPVRPRPPKPVRAEAPPQAAVKVVTVASAKRVPDEQGTRRKPGSTVQGHQPPPKPKTGPIEYEE